MSCEGVIWNELKINVWCFWAWVHFKEPLSIDLNTGFVHFLGLAFPIDFYNETAFLAQDNLESAGFVHPDAFAGDNRALMLAHT